MILYHGSNIEIDNIDLNKCRPGKDFGKGFYLNPNFEQARRIAKKAVKIQHEGKEIVNAFGFDNGLSLEEIVKITQLSISEIQSL